MAPAARHCGLHDSVDELAVILRRSQKSNCGTYTDFGGLVSRAIHKRAA
jgi:hypothetical protein